MSVNSKMTAIANGLRKLLGLSGVMGLDDMANNISTAQNEVDTQSNLIAQLSSVLNSKVGGIVPQGILNIDKNGIHDVTTFASAQVNVPVPSGYIKPSGTASITTNGTHDISQHEYANVSVTLKLEQKSVDPKTFKQTITPGSGYDGLSKVTVEAIKTATQATPGITVNTAGLITASATQTEGYVTSGTKSATKQLTTQAAQTITPGTSDKTIALGRYLTGTQTIKGDANLVAGNIKEGVSIFGVTGTLKTSNVQIQDLGTIHTDNQGTAYVQCGFTPDILYIDFGGYFESQYRITAGLCFVAAEHMVSSAIFGNGNIIKIYGTKLYNAATLSFRVKTPSDTEYSECPCSISCVAVKLS